MARVQQLADPPLRGTAAFRGRPAGKEGAAAVAEALTLADRLLDQLQLLAPAQLLQIERHLRDSHPIALDDPARADASSLAALQVRNLLRVWAGWGHFLERSLPGNLVQRQLGVSRQRLQQLRAAGKIIGLAVPGRREFYYPVWQFDPDGFPLASLPRLLAAAEEARLSLETLDVLMTTPESGGGTPLADRLRRGDEAQVLAAVRAAVALGM